MKRQTLLVSFLFLALFCLGSCSILTQNKTKDSSIERRSIASRAPASVQEEDSFVKNFLESVEAAPSGRYE